MPPKLSTSDSRRLDDAARAGWLYYVAGKTQDDIAKHLGMSRQSAQRLVALAVSEGLIRVRLEHPIAKCMDLAQKIQQRFQLRGCEVVPSEQDNPSSTVGLAQAGAAEIERYLRSSQPLVVALGTGRALKACVEELAPRDCKQHKIVALVGNMTNEGSATDYDAVVRMAERINAKHYPMPLPVMPASVTEKEQLQSYHYVSNILSLANKADVTFVGIGSLALNSPLHKDGFVTEKELFEVQELGAVGEVIGWVFNKEGKLLDCSINSRVASASLQEDTVKPVVGIAAGEDKVHSILGALRSKLVNTLITNEYTAERLLSVD